MKRMVRINSINFTDSWSRDGGSGLKTQPNVQFGWHANYLTLLRCSGETGLDRSYYYNDAA
jgi:hypothetical protein